MSSFGKNIRCNIFGESHGPAIGVVIEGLEPGIKLDMDKIQKMLDRRRPGKDRYVTNRNEGDVPEILSGTYNGMTTGMPLCAVIRNKDARSRDYRNLRKVPRPGHSDYTAHVKYNGFNDIRGGGAFSGRLTAPLVFACDIAKGVLEEKGITNYEFLGSTYVSEIVKLSNDIIVVADHSKFGRNVLTNVMPFNRVSTFITDSGVPKRYIEKFSKYSIKHRIADL